MSGWSRWRALILAVAGFGGAATIHGLFHLVDPSTVRPVPSLAALPWLVAAASAVVMIASAVIVGRRQPRRARTIGSWVLHLVLVLGGAAGTVGSDPEFPFGHHYVDSLTLPGSRGTAYLFRGGLFCDQTVWVAAPGEWLAYRELGRTSYECADGATLTWDADQGKAEVVGPDGRALGSDRRFEGLFLGPH